ncbi:hypothetical protein AAT19DRAFT_16235 [Rhodotorula toruloides]|uniref:Uncharacterized protein n=1 Tax=Rhodotorula toruloides TaxID=5286 RepID=A0A2T0A634_RHOTO|nr:hypothetical protein AAT19DRAFT_16235 [Rhodotorula toruloides]
MTARTRRCRGSSAERERASLGKWTPAIQPIQSTDYWQSIEVGSMACDGVRAPFTLLLANLDRSPRAVLPLSPASPSSWTATRAKTQLDPSEHTHPRSPAAPSPLPALPPSLVVPPHTRPAHTHRRTRPVPRIQSSPPAHSHPDSQVPRTSNTLASDIRTSTQPAPRISRLFGSLLLRLCARHYETSTLVSAIRLSGNAGSA